MIYGGIPLPPPRNKTEMIQQIELLEKSIKQKAITTVIVLTAGIFGLFGIILMVWIKIISIN